MRVLSILCSPAVLGRTPREFTTRCIAGVLVFVAIVAVVLPLSPSHNTIVGSDPNGPKEALGLLKDTTQWMAGIQTATLAALGLITKEGITSLKPNSAQLRLSILVAVLNSAALFFSAWVLTALPSVALRVYADPVCNYDFFNLGIYPFLDDLEMARIFSVQFVAFCNHWLWGIGALLFGWLCVSITISRSRKEPAPAPRRVRR